jgi:hypothetical protein
VLEAMKDRTTPAAKKAGAPEAKTARYWRATIDTKAAALQTEGPTFWAFRSHVATLYGLGTATEAYSYERFINHGRALSHYPWEAATADEVAALNASAALAVAKGASAMSAAATSAEPPFFVIASEMTRHRGAAAKE